MEQRPINMSIKQMFSGVQPSRGAEDLAIRALNAGINPIVYTIKAGMASLQEGRTKAGFFGGGKKPLGELQKELKKFAAQKIRNKAIEKSIPHP